MTVRLLSKRLELLEGKVERLGLRDIHELLDKIKHIEDLWFSSKDVLSMEEAALYLDLSKSTIYKLTHTMNIPHYKPMGKKIFFDKKELELWVRQGRVDAVDTINNDNKNED